jgi:glycosyltransferase involved in cell wall biosynthesis
VPDVVREGETGFLIDGVEESELTADITSILERDDLDQISRNGRALVLDEYSFEAAVKRYRTILTEID